tara:strand:- start:2025 stop:2534 length:510 start_codon:yes stop_codon:yes gene_type:complete
MKTIVDKFRKFITEAPKESYVEGEGMSLYHYTRSKEDILVLDPDHRRGSHSTREFETATTPRIFFYLDPQHRERFFQRASLYKVDVPANRVYDLRNDPEGHIAMHKDPTYGLRKGMEWDDLLEHIRESYDGIFYSTSNFDVVAWFHPIEVTRVSPEEQAQLEGEQGKRR